MKRWTPAFFGVLVYGLAASLFLRWASSDGLAKRLIEDTDMYVYSMCWIMTFFLGLYVLWKAAKEEAPWGFFTLARRLLGLSFAATVLVLFVATWLIPDFAKTIHTELGPMNYVFIAAGSAILSLVLAILGAILRAIFSC